MSSPVPVWHGVITDGVLRLDARSLFAGYVKRLKNGPVTLTLKRLTRRKSQQQGGYIWGVLYPIIAEHCGYADFEIEALHDALMRRLRGLKPEPNPLQLRVSLADMTHEEVSAYIEDLRMFALTELGCETPDATKVEIPKTRVPEAA